MSRKLPWMKFYPSDWMRDTRCLSLPARGVWIDLICILWGSQTRGSKTLDMEGWAGEVGRPADETEKIFFELEKKQILKMKRESNGDVTLTCRRQVREEISRESTRLRVEKHRNASCNASCNGNTLDCNGNVRGRSQKSDVRSQKLETKNKDKEDSQNGLQFDSAATTEKSAINPVHGAPYIASEKFWAKLKANPAYQHLDLDHESARMDAWLLVHPGRQKTLRFAVNWLNKLPPPLTAASTQPGARRPSGIKTLAEVQADSRKRQAERDAELAANPLDPTVLNKLSPNLRRIVERNMSHDLKKDDAEVAS